MPNKFCDCNVCRKNPRPRTVLNVNTGGSVSGTISSVDVARVINALTNLGNAATTFTATLTTSGSGGSGGTTRVTSWSADYASTTPPDIEEYWTPETITGWRNWRLAGNGLTVLLGMNNAFWRKPSIEASHRGPSTIPHNAPSWGCNCGINAVKGLDTLLVSNGLASQRSHTIYGTVAMSGIVHEYELGYRAQRATVTGLFLIAKVNDWTPTSIWEKRADILRKHYRCPVRLTLNHDHRLDTDIVKEHIIELQGADK